ncbi:hypothetical protein D3C87_1777430 [compost metagenome]
MREQGVGLEHHVNRPLVWRHVRHVLPIEHDLPFRRLFKTGQHAQQRRLAAAGGAQQGKYFAFVDGQANVFDRILAVKGFGEVTDFQQRGEDLLRLGLRTRDSVVQSGCSPVQTVQKTTAIAMAQNGNAGG